jgi:hypothetical protein
MTEGHDRVHGDRIRRLLDCHIGSSWADGSCAA